jgi:hypothetical protein
LELPSIAIAKTGSLFKTGNGVSEQVKVTTNFRGKNGETNRILQTAQAIVLGAEASEYLANGKISGRRCN